MSATRAFEISQAWRAGAGYRYRGLLEVACFGLRRSMVATAMYSGSVKPAIMSDLIVEAAAVASTPASNRETFDRALLNKLIFSTIVIDRQPSVPSILQ